MPGLANDRVDYVVALLARGPDQKPRLVASDDLGNLLVSLQSNAPGANNFVTGQVSVGHLAATLIVPARSNRQSVIVFNLGGVDVYLGGSLVSTLSGIPLVGIKGAFIGMDATSDIYGIASSGSQQVAFAELY